MGDEPQEQDSDSLSHAETTARLIRDAMTLYAYAIANAPDEPDEPPGTPHTPQAD